MRLIEWLLLSVIEIYDVQIPITFRCFIEKIAEYKKAKVCRRSKFSDSLSISQLIYHPLPMRKRLTNLVIMKFELEIISKIILIVKKSLVSL